MYTVDLQKELKKITDKELADANQYITLANEYLKEAVDADENTIKNIFGNGMFDDIKDAQKTIDVKTKLQLAGLDVFTEAQLRKLCLKYNLRCLNTTRYRGTIDPIVPQKDKEIRQKIKDAGFSIEQSPNKSKGLNSDREKLTDNYYIIAPVSSFVLDKKPKDPLLFVQIKDTDYYVLVHKWGDDLSVKNRLIGFYKMHEWAFMLLYLAAAIIIDVHNHNVNFILTFLGIFAFILFKGLIESEEFGFGYSYRENWNSIYGPNTKKLRNSLNK